MKNYSTPLSKDFAEAENDFLHFYAGVKNRTEVYRFTDETGIEEIKDWRVPQGTWRVTIRNEGFNDFNIIFPNGRSVNIRGRVGTISPMDDQLILAGSPYIERDDVFTISFVPTLSNKVCTIVVDRIVKNNT